MGSATASARDHVTSDVKDDTLFICGNTGNVNDIKRDTNSLLVKKVVQSSLGLLVLLVGYSGVEHFGCTRRELVINKVKYICIP